MPRAIQTMTAQRGMAIISALLIVTVVAVIAAGMLSRQSVQTRALEAEQARVQGSSVLLGGLEVGRRWLWSSRQRDSLTRLDQRWAQPIVHASLQGAERQFAGRLVDQQGKFNLRNLLAQDLIDAAEVRNFARLCALIGLDASLAQRISARVIASYPHLLDAPGQPLPVPASQPMLGHVDDLRGIAGLDEPTLARLDQFVSVIPANTRINGNTASAEVLAAVVPGLSLEQARALVQARDRGQWFVNRGDFVNRLRLPQVSVEDVVVGTTSDWFLFQAQTRHGRRGLSLQTLLHRTDEGLPQVVWSRFGP